jgi:hypothetical protein
VGDRINWQEYEREITESFRSQYPNAKIIPNAPLPGRFSKIERQIDLLVEDQVVDFVFRIAIDAKHYSERIDVKDVEQFLGLLNDVGVDVGVMISPEGYSQAAINRAHYDNSRLELDVLNFADLKMYQGFGAIPYSSGVGVAMPAPFGWVIDARHGHTCSACLYQRGKTLDDAISADEWMYVKFSLRDATVPDLAKLLEIHDEYTMKLRPDTRKSFLDGVKRHDGATTLIRCHESSAYPVPEFSGFVQFDKFIFFCVLFSPMELQERNLRKLRYILRTALPIQIEVK